MPPPRSITRRAYAKVNLALAVGPPEPAGSPNAGMHPIASWMHAVDLFDTVEATVDEGRGWRVEWAADAPRPSPIDWPAEKDLAARAREFLEQVAGRPLPVGLRITKRVPAGGGLGGGSSDGAAALLAINDLMALRLTAAELAAISRGLGSDAAYFVDPSDGPPAPALVTGLGDRIERTPRAAGDLVLIVPPFGCPTGAVYRAYNAAGGFRADEAARLAREARLEAERLFNDLTPAAERVEPRLAGVMERARLAAGRPVHMSGSGSTVFVVARTGESGPIASMLASKLPDVTVSSVRLV